MKKLLYFLFMALPFCGMAQTLQLEASANKTNILSGEQLTYTFKYTCAAGTGNCTNVTLVATIPTGIIFPTQSVALTTDIASYNISPDQKTITFVFKEPLAAGSTGIVQVNGEAIFGSADMTTGVLTGDLKSGGVTQSSQNVSATIHSSIKLCPQKFTVTGLALDSPTKYVIRITNQGNYGETGFGTTNSGPITIFDQLPTGTVINSVSVSVLDGSPGPVIPPGACTFNNANSTFTCTLPASTTKIQSKYAASFDITAYVTYPSSAGFIIGQNVVNNATVTYQPEGSASPITISNGTVVTYQGGTTYATATTQTCTSTLTVTDKLQSPTKILQVNKAGPSTMRPGEAYRYDINIGNPGNSELTDLVVEDAFPTGIIITQINFPNWTNLIGDENIKYWIKTTANPVYTQLTVNQYNNYVTPTGTTVTHFKVTADKLPSGSFSNNNFTVYFTVDPTTTATSIQNCLTHSSSSTGYTLAPASTLCNTFTVLPPDPFSTLQIEKFITQSKDSQYNSYYGGPINVGTTFWNLMFLSIDGGGQPLSNPVVMDFLPIGLDYVGNTYYYPGTPPADVVEVIPNFNGSGRTLVRYKWNNPWPSPSNYALSFQAKVNQYAQGGLVSDYTIGQRMHPYSNIGGIKNAAFFTGSSAKKCKVKSNYSPKSEWETPDTYDLNSNGATATDTLCYDTDYVGVTSSAQLSSVKWVKGQCETVYTKHPDYGTTTPGGLANYKLIVKNNGNVPATHIEILDMLPYIGDIGVKDLTARLTQWRPNLVTPLSTPTSITVYYTTVQNPCRTDYSAGGPAGCNPPNWTTVLPSDPTTVQGLKFDFGAKILNPGDEIELAWDMRAPVNAPTNNEIAWNSFGFKAVRADNNDPFLPAEPNKVGIKVKPVVPGAYGNFVWIDTNKDGKQDAGEVGIDGVRVELHQDNGDGIADPKNDPLVSFTATGNGGLYLFPNLAPGNYFAVFFVPNGYSTSPANVVTPNDSLDSDGIPTLCNGNRVTVTAITGIAATQTDIRWDQGVFIDKAALGNYVWFDENSNNIQDESTTNGVNGIVVCLYKDVNNSGTAEPDGADGAPVARDTTGTDIYGRPGYYLFENLDPGKYFVKFKLNTGQTFTPTTGSTNGSSDPTDSDPTTAGLTEVTDITAGEVDLSWDAGIIIATGPYKLGNLVWSDINNDGKVDANESGINGVTVSLYEDRNNNNKPDPDEYISSTTTSTLSGIAGTYWFERLPAGTYIVQIPDANYSGPLLDYTTSTGNDPAPDPDDNIENDDNGSLVAGCGVISKPITLGANAEPLDAGTTNATVDFGFYKCAKPNYTASVVQPTCAGGKGSISIANGTIGDKVGYSTGTTYTGTYASAVAISSLTGGVVVGNIVGSTTADQTYTIRMYNGLEACFKDITFTIPKLSCCTKPVASAVAKTQTICAGSTAAAYTASPSTGVEYQWYGPLADTTGTLGTAISGQTTASYTPTGTALTTTGTTYYAVIVNTTGNATCADTAFVVLTVTAKPVINDGTATICAGESVDLTSKITNYATLVSRVWTVATAGGTAVLTPTAVKPIATTTYVLVAQNDAGCKDTANVVVTVNLKPNAGKDTTLACVNAINNTLATSYTLVPNPTGGSWAQIGTTPVTATITGNAVTAMTVAGTYQFEYILNGCKDTVAVTVSPCAGCVKPDAGPDATPVCQPATTAKLTAVTAGGTWAAIGSPANPAAATIDANGNISGLTAAGTYKFVYSITGGGQTCTDTAQVIVNAKPTIVDGTATICAGESVDLTSKITKYATLVSPVWTLTTASGTTVSTPTSVKPNTNTTYVLVAQNAEGCKDTATVVVTVNPKPNAGADIVGANAICTSVGAVTLTGTPANGTWAQIGTTPGVATISSAGVVSAMTSVGTYQFTYTLNGCIDTVSVETKNCAKGSLGDLVWKDANDNGIQDLPAEKGVKGVIVQLLNAATNAVLATDTTDAAGIYSFTGLESGDYKVKILLTSLPDTCQISKNRDVNTGGGNDTNDSDFNPTSGESQVVTISTTGTGIAKDNPTIDAALVVPCTKSKVTLTGAPVCSADVQTYSVTFNLTNKLGTVKVNKGTLTGTNPYTVTGVPSGATLTITDSLSAVCKFDTLITGPNCNCTPPVPTLLTPSLTACIGDTFPTLKATVVGLATVEWFASASGGAVLFTGLNYKPSGTIPAGGTVFYAQARSTDPTCPVAISTTRAPATINAQDCTKEVDLALKKYINKKIALIGDELTYTVKVFNQSNTAATGVEVTDSIATTVQFVAGSFVPSRGSATITGNVIKWVIGGIAANPGTNGDTVTLVYKVKATQTGLHFNTAEISKTNEKDVDSTPDNGKEGEDDIDRQCFTVPAKLCTNEKVQVSVPAKYTKVQWFKNGGTTAVATGNVVLLTEVGTYTFTSTNQTCPDGGCCPVIIESGTNCCLPQICVPLTVKKIK